MIMLVLCGSTVIGKEGREEWAEDTRKRYLCWQLLWKVWRCLSSLPGAFLQGDMYLQTEGVLQLKIPELDDELELWSMTIIVTCSSASSGKVHVGDVCNRVPVSPGCKLLRVEAVWEDGGFMLSLTN